ncbi:hypothetical protein SLA2020_506530 [Shorea laevis]
MGEPLIVRIERKLQGHVLVDRSACSIFKVPKPLREKNKKAYEPQVISIGPYHHGKDHLKAMEVQKMNSLKFLLDRTKEIGLEMYVTALVEIEEETRKFYSESLDHIGGKELVEMMLFDGCFIIELIFHSTMHTYLTDFYLREAMRDLLLVENQLPFCVLSKLYSLSSCLPLNIAKDRMAHAAISFFDIMMPGPLITARPGNQEVKHILGLLHDLSYLSEEVKRVICTPPSSVTAVSFPCWPPCLAPASLLPRSPSSAKNLSAGVVIDPPAQAVPEKSSTQKWQFIRSATELNDAGIKFQANEGIILFDIKFQNGVISIPTLKIDDDTECILRNLVAYEQCYKGISSTCFTDYSTFMDRLINTGNDVELLCRCGILDNWLGDHEVVATMFNRLGDSVLISDTGFFYAEIFNGVNEHCNRKWNLWKANLRHNYFNTPWASISFIAAVILLLSTFVASLVFNSLLSS